MGNCLISYPNRVDEATLSGGSWETALPLANLQDRQLGKVARTTDATLASTQFDVTFPATRTIRVVKIVNHNLDQDAQIRVTMGTTLGASDVYDSGWVDAWQMGYDANLIPWGTAGAWRGIDGDEFNGHDRGVGIVTAGGWFDTRYLRVEIDNTTNADGYVQFGRPFFGGGVIPARNMSYGVREGWRDRTQVFEARSGAEFFDELAPYRVAEFSLDWLSDLEFQRFYEMQRLLGISGEVYWLPDSEDAAVQQRQGFLGRLEELSLIEYPYVNTRRKAFRIKELQP